MRLGEAIKRIDTVYERETNRMLQKYGVTLAQTEVMRYLHDCQEIHVPVNQKMIETALMLKNPTVTGILDRLEAKGLIARRQDPVDRRVNIIGLTATAARMRREMMAIMMEWENGQTAALAPEEYETLMRLLQKVLGHISHE